jgi:hypothetical protein
MEQALLPVPEDFPDAEERRLLYRVNPRPPPRMAAVQ